jgi:Xaa-Pro aminopeptidase
VDFYHNRRAQLLRGGKADEVDAYLVTHQPNVRYLTGLDAADAVLVTPKGAFALCREELAGLCK